jgi:integrase
MSSRGSGKLRWPTSTPPLLLEVLRRIEARGVIETAHRAWKLQPDLSVWHGRGLATTNPAQGLKIGLKRPQPKHFAAITEPARLAQLLRACDGYAATHVVRAALKLQPMLLLRPGEFRAAEWSEIDLDNALWTVPAARMKRQLLGQAERRTAPGSLAQTGRRRVARAPAPDRRREAGLSG